MTGLGLQQVCMAVPLTTTHHPTLAMKPGDHLPGSSPAPQLPSSGQARGKLASTLTEFSISLRAAGGTKEPHLALQVNSREAGQGHVGVAAFTAATHS